MNTPEREKREFPFAPATEPIGMFRDAWQYSIDAWQRTILFWDVLRERGNQYLSHLAETVPHVLRYDVELVLSGKALPRPVNYGLVRIKPPAGVSIDERKRPFVVVDPRAGHGPGIGGFKADSEIGVAMQAGHPCYFIGFLPEPVPGQTIEDIMQAEAAFLERVIELHPLADGKPCVIGNCQAGWAIMMLAAVRPELFGPIIVAGSPLSYWAGVRGVNPLRYTGGLLGGSWLTALTSDLGNGKFDGAWLVSNFESLNPANTLWTKQYNVWSKVDTEAPRYLEFERWWGGHVNLNAEEIQFIVDELFVGNKLATAEIATSDGVRIDLRNIRSPILCFCSKGDDITPPQQALGWITDLYESVDDIRAHGQTIVYAVHESVGHLGIFVSGKVATKEHSEFASNIDLIDVLPPGLYEAVMIRRGEADSDELVSGDWIVRLEPRSVDDIRALGGNGEEDERRFATVRRVSEINLGLYRTFMQPFVRTVANETTAEWLSRLHPARLQFELFSDRNPFMAGVGQVAAEIRERRQSATRDNVFVQGQQAISQQIEKALEVWGEMRDRAQEQIFLAVYGSPAIQAMVGLKGSDAPARRRPGDEPEARAFLSERIADLKSRIPEGGMPEAWIRACLYAGRGGGFDERHLAMLRQIREKRGGDMTLQEFKNLLREQALMLLIDEPAALAALPLMLPDDRETRNQAFGILEKVIEATGETNEETSARLETIERVFAGDVDTLRLEGSARPRAVAGPRKLPARSTSGERRKA
jgi:pimeloyl-ACP methyl ester carboxylesterase